MNSTKITPCLNKPSFPIVTKIGDGFVVKTEYITRGTTNSVVECAPQHKLYRYKRTTHTNPERVYEEHDRFVRRMYQAVTTDLIEDTPHWVLNLFVNVHPGMLLTRQFLSHRDTGWTIHLDSSGTKLTIRHPNPPLSDLPWPKAGDDLQPLFDWLVQLGKHTKPLSKTCPSCSRSMRFDYFEYHCWVCEYCDMGKPDDIEEYCE